VACPYFFPTEKSWTIAWPFPRRLPLGSGFCGTCRAAVELQTPSDDELKDFCNLGYASKCSRLPAERHADCVRFSVTKHQGDQITLSYVYEREHAPVQHGQLEYDCAAQRWLAPLEDACVQRQAECYLGTYLERK
jgi:hypothetical protein